MPLTLTRSLLVILVPGVIAVGPWLFVLMRLFPEAGRVYHAYETATHVCVFALVVVVGSIIEGLNTHLELWFDREREAEFQIERNWYDYLAAQCSSEPVAFPYISRLVTMLYFELSMVWAVLLFACGIATNLLLSDPLRFRWWVAGLVVAAAPGSAYFLWQARCTHKALCKTRLELNRRLNPPTPAESPPE